MQFGRDWNLNRSRKRDKENQMLEMISYTVGNDNLIRFNLFPRSYISKYLRTGEIKRHPKLKTVYQFWFKKSKQKKDALNEPPSEFYFSDTYLNGELLRISVE